MAQTGKPFPEYVNGRVAATFDSTTAIPVAEGVNGRKLDKADLDGQYVPLVHLTESEAHDAVDLTVGDIFSSTFSPVTVSEALTGLDDKVEDRSTLRMISAIIGNVATWDDFLGADNASSLSGRAAPGGGTWTVVNGTWGITSNRAYVSALASGVAVATILGTKNCYMALTVRTTLSARVQGMLARYIDVNNFLYVGRLNDGGPGGYLAIKKRDGGVDSNLAISAAIGETINDASRLECWVQGETITAHWGGQVLTHRLTGADATKFNAELPTVGIVQESTASLGSASWCDNFVVVGHS